MTITCSYGTWNRTIDKHTLTLEQSVEGALNGEYTVQQIDTVTAAYRDAINAALPDSVSLCGDQLYGPYTPGDNEFDGYPLCNMVGESADDAPPWADPADYQSLDIGAIVAGIDFWAIVEQVTDRPKPNRW
jgi:hypothetical protein